MPVFVFGEKWMYNRLVFPESVRKWCLKTLRIPLLVFWWVDSHANTLLHTFLHPHTMSSHIFPRFGVLII